MLFYYIMSSFNEIINGIKVQNYYTEPVGEPRFDNPYLLKSNTKALNDILAHLQTPQQQQPPPPPPQQPTVSPTEPPLEPTPTEPPLTPTIPTDPEAEAGAIHDGANRRRGHDATTAILPAYTQNSPNLQSQFVDWQTSNDPTVVPDVATILNRIPQISVGDNDTVSFMVGQPDTLVVQYENGEYQTFSFGTNRMVTMNDRSRTPPRSDGLGEGQQWLSQRQTPRYP
jgi:hypothetical protein